MSAGKAQAKDEARRRISGKVSDSQRSENRERA